MNSKYYIPLKERIGYLVLIILVVVSHQLSGLKEYFFDSRNQIDLEKIQISMDEMNTSILGNNVNINKEYLFREMFNPNTATEDQLNASGMSEKAVSNLIKYRNKGGKFKRPEDLLKVYAIDSAYVVDITPYLNFPVVENEVSRTKGHSSKSTIKYQSEKSEISKATRADLSKINAFDPNTTSGDILTSLGFSDYAIKNLIKYRDKGGRIYQPADLLKIYGVDSTLFQSIADKIQIPQTGKISIDKTFEISDSSSSYTIEEFKGVIDLNQTNAEELTNLRGIGPVLSKRIIEYRNKLGGYLSVDQLHEVYGISAETFDLIVSKLEVSPGHSKIYIPELTFKEVLRHPYMDYETTKLVKNISILDFDKKIKSIIEENLLDPRIVPYIQLTDPTRVSGTETEM